MSKSRKRIAIFRKSWSRACWYYFFADCSKYGRDFRRKYPRERSRREKYQRFQTRKTYSTAAEHSRDEVRSNADLITGQTSCESHPGRDFISSAVGEMRRRKAGRREEIEEERESIALVYPYSSSDIGVCSYLSNKALRVRILAETNRFCLWNVHSWKFLEYIGTRTNTKYVIPKHGLWDKMILCASRSFVSCNCLVERN